MQDGQGVCWQQLCKCVGYYQMYHELSDPAWLKDRQRQRLLQYGALYQMTPPWPLACKTLITVSSFNMDHDFTSGSLPDTGASKTSSYIPNTSEHEMLDMTQDRIVGQGDGTKEGQSVGLRHR